jgi:hypothetical protein
MVSKVRADPREVNPNRDADGPKVICGSYS